VTDTAPVTSPPLAILPPHTATVSTSPQAAPEQAPAPVLALPSTAPRPEGTPAPTWKPPAPAPHQRAGTRQSARLRAQAQLRALSAAEQVRQYEEDHAVDVGNRALRVIVLFGGSGTVESAIRAFYSHNDIEIVSVDNNPKSSATIVTQTSRSSREQS